ncbi:MAG TPA: XRE family transcriptional regulator [Prolixibacteraceae bacterium]|nr:XRE family transcriptional regulator [Prolixibacteraceae bacterium]
MKIMNEQIEQIAARIKELREIAGVSAESFAHELNIGTELFLNYENGTTDIPIGFLSKVARRFNMELLALLCGDEPRLHVYSVVRKGKGLNVDRQKQYQYESLAYNFIQKKAEPFIVTVQPDTSRSQTEFNSHPGQEFNYVLEGSLMIEVNGHEITLNEGDSIYFDSGYKHAMKALNDQPARFLALIV